MAEMILTKVSLSLIDSLRASSFPIAPLIAADPSITYSGKQLYFDTTEEVKIGMQDPDLWLRSWHSLRVTRGHPGGERGNRAPSGRQAPWYFRRHDTGVLYAARFEDEAVWTGAGVVLGTASRGFRSRPRRNSRRAM